MIKTVVIAVDGSAAAREAARVGLELAEGLGAEALIVHGSRHLSRREFEVAAEGREVPARELDPVLRTAGELSESKGVRSKFQIWPADGVEEVAGVVTAIADTNEPSLIVVGSRGRGSVSGALLGSVSRAILGTSGQPVVVVHAPKPAPR